MLLFSRTCEKNSPFYTHVLFRIGKEVVKDKTTQQLKNGIQDGNPTHCEGYSLLHDDRA